MNQKTGVAKFGICCRNMGRNDLTLLLLANLNRIMSEDSRVTPIIFAQEVAPHLAVIPCPIMSFNEVWCFTHPVLAVNFSSAKTLLDVPGPTKLYYYIHELPSPSDDNFFEINRVINDPKLTVLVRSDLHRDIITNNYGRKDIKIIGENELLDVILGKENINV